MLPVTLFMSSRAMQLLYMDALPPPSFDKNFLGDHTRSKAAIRRAIDADATARARRPRRRLHAEVGISTGDDFLSAAPCTPRLDRQPQPTYPTTRYITPRASGA